MTIYQHKPRKGDAVWVEGEAKPNGFIFDIDWHSQEAIVKFHGGGIREISFDLFWGNRVGNKWMLELEYNQHDEYPELKHDIHILFDATIADKSIPDKEKTARLMYLSKYFSNKHCFKDGSKRRKDQMLKWLVEHGVDNAEVGRLMVVYRAGLHRSRSLAGKTS